MHLSPHFLKRINKQLLFDLDCARFFSFLAFYDFLSSFNFDTITSLKVAVVSGGQEPELSLLPSNSVIDILSYEDNPAIWNLNYIWDSDVYLDYFGKYDFVICEQVLEHVNDPMIALTNISRLLHPNGVLHISVPAINGIHGLPNYCYSGFSQSLVHHISSLVNLSVVSSGSWGNKKLSMFYSICHWPSLAFLSPFIFLTNLSTFFSRLSRARVRILFQSLYYNLFVLPFGRTLTNDSQSPVIHWAFLRKS